MDLAWDEHALGAGGKDADEEEADEERGNEELRRLRDIIDDEEAGENEPSEEEEELAISAAGAAAAAAAATELPQRQRPGIARAARTVAAAAVAKQAWSAAEVRDVARTWSWDIPAVKRWAAVARLLHSMSGALLRLRVAAESCVTEARRNRAEAGAQTFKTARVVGATVVGAARRLAAIRAAEPFAVVVEEACEVMEPTLMAVLAVKSLQKLELVGDHRQLPAFVQNCWFNFETSQPSIKTSLFERLVEGRVSSGTGRRRGGAGAGADDAGQAERAASTVLDEQRRMRSNIADITRPDYEDMVAIVDHPVTASQAIGDKAPSAILRGPLQSHREIWDTKGVGNEVPGVCTNIYFWNIRDNRQGRPLAGLSACNPSEAEAVVGLTSWLIFCGVPRGSITIITPYKGQKTVIIKELRAAGVLPKFNREGVVPDSTVNVNVSTVDRYQGDENDVVILSLVRTQPGNRFVGLLNRFIVATSRARLGFYVVGSVEAVTKDRGGGKGPAHWRRFVEALEEPSVGGPAAFAGSRVGEALPICCPRHRTPDPRSLIVRARDFPAQPIWEKFCALPCPYVLSNCGHPCRVGCHSPSAVPHTAKCVEPVVRPCELHRDIPLPCHQACGGAERPKPLKQALAEYKCDVKVEYQRRDCAHREKLTCNLNERLRGGTAQLPECKTVVGDFVHPACGHVFASPKCYERRQFENAPPRCQQRVHVTRPCGCTTQMECWEAIQDAVAAPGGRRCMESVARARPRCSHVLTLRCHLAAELQDWWEMQRGASAFVVEDGEMEVTEGGVFGPPEKLFKPAFLDCAVPTRYRRACQHLVANVPCHLAFSFAAGLQAPLLPPCDTKVAATSPHCGHAVKVRCSLQAELVAVAQWCRERTSCDAEGCVEVLDLRLARPPAAPGPNFSPAVIRAVQSACGRRLRVRQSCGRAHTEEIPCAQLWQVLLGRLPMRPCTALVTLMLPCAHERVVECAAAAQPPGPCGAVPSESYTFSCGEHSVKPESCHQLHRLRTEAPRCAALVDAVRFRCRHAVRARCADRELLEAAAEGLTLKRVGGSGAGGEQVVEAGAAYCELELGAPPCAELVTFRRPCGHTVPNVPCSTAFDWAQDASGAPRCDALVDRESALCGHAVRMACWTVGVEWQPWGAAPRGESFEQEVTGVDEHGDAITMRVVRFGGPKPGPLPPGFCSDSLRCSSFVTYVRECGHTQRCGCVDAFLDRVPPCRETVSVACKVEECQSERQIMCFEDDSQKTGVALRCPSMRSRACCRCGITTLRVECHKSNVECESSVKAQISCGHEVSWKCGEDPDPRDELTKYICLACMRPKWDASIAAANRLSASADEVRTEKERAFIRAVRSRVFDLLGASEAEHGAIKHESALPANFTAHYEARKKILEAYASSRLDIEVCAPPAEFGSGRGVDDMLDNYRIVFQIQPTALASKPSKQKGSSGGAATGAGARNNKVVTLPPADIAKNLATKLADMQSTVYGRCCQLLELLRLEDLGRGEGEGSTVNVSIGVAFFYKSPNGEVGEMCPSEKKKELQKANQRAMTFVKKGLDHAYIGRQQHVYWVPGVVLPMFSLAVNVRVKCCICQEYFMPKAGFFCSKNHFVCWKECFDGYVESAAKPGAIGRTVDQQGTLMCPGERCGEAYNLYRIAQSGPRGAFEKLMQLRMQAGERAAAAAAAQDERQRMTEEFERIQKIRDLDERAGAILRREIIDGVLTLRCPRCRLAFVDFDGCFALTCANNACRCGFCAWCLRDCGGDAHQHVATEHGAMYDTQQNFNNFHRERRRNLVVAHLDRARPEARAWALRLLEGELRDLDIIIPP